MKFLNIEDKDIIISKILIDGNTKIIYLEKTLKVEYCPACSPRMHSKGKYIRKINHPIRLLSIKTYYNSKKMEMYQLK